MPDSARISPTAHYTGYVWHRFGLSYPGLATGGGRALYVSSWPLFFASRAFTRGVTLDGILLARHLVIDHLLEEGVRSGAIGQVVELAAGLSPRGVRFTKRHGDRLRYVEADLPGMAATKRERLSRGGLFGPDHVVVEVDILAEEGAHRIGHILETHLDPDRGTAVITEGLVNYFDRASVEGMAGRLARGLARFPRGVYLSDIHTQEDVRVPLAGLLRGAVGVFARGATHVHYRDADEARKALTGAGFDSARLHAPIAEHADVLDGYPVGTRDSVRVLEARVGAW